MYQLSFLQITVIIIFCYKRPPLDIALPKQHYNYLSTFTHSLDFLPISPFINSLVIHVNCCSKLTTALKIGPSVLSTPWHVSVSYNDIGETPGISCNSLLPLRCFSDSFLVTVSLDLLLLSLPLQVECLFVQSYVAQRFCQSELRLNY